LRSGADLPPRQLTRNAERTTSRRLSFLATCPRPLASFGPRARPLPCTHERRRHLPHTGPLPLHGPPPLAENSPSRCLTAQTKSSRPAPLPLGNRRAETLRGGSRGPRHERAHNHGAHNVRHRFQRGGCFRVEVPPTGRHGLRRRKYAGSTPQVRRARAAVSRPASASWPRFPTPNASSRCPTPSQRGLPATTPVSPLSALRMHLDARLAPRCGGEGTSEGGSRCGWAAPTGAARPTRR
jgi:hypothetical protein